jgi:transcriptional regulator with XRE-family HTH domain
MDLREFRKAQGLQRKFVAIKVGICGKHLNDIEAGRVNLTDKVAFKLSEVYGADLSEIKHMYQEGKNGKHRDYKKTARAS